MQPNDVSPSPRQTSRRSWLALAAVCTALVGGALWWTANQPETPRPTTTVARRTLEVRDGVFFQPGSTTAFTGRITDHYEDGSVKLRTEVVAGRLHGESVGWFTNGVQELVEHFRDGKPHGVRTTWDESGRKRSEGGLVEGRQAGVFRQWHENGQLAAEAAFADGEPHGLSVAWHPDGSLKAEAMMDHGKVLDRRVYPVGTRWEPSLAIGETLSRSTAQSK
jgi:hypothetical protein